MNAARVSLHARCLPSFHVGVAFLPVAPVSSPEPGVGEKGLSLRLPTSEWVGAPRKVRW